MEIQIVGSRIPEDQLVEVRSTLQAIAVANGTALLETWLQNMRQFDREQLLISVTHCEQKAAQAQRDVQLREQEWVERLQNADQTASQLEMQLEHLRNERDQEARALRETQSVLEERTRQMDKWKSLYDNIKQGQLGLSSSSASLSVPPTAPQHQSFNSRQLPPPPSVPPSPQRTKFSFPIGPRSKSEMPSTHVASMSSDAVSYSSSASSSSLGMGPTGGSSLGSNRVFSRPGERFSSGLGRIGGFAAAGSGGGAQVRSSFFTPASLRGVSPAARKLNHFGSGQGSGMFGGVA